VAGVIGAVLLGTAPLPASADVAGPVVLLGTGGVRWADVDASTPTLQKLLDQGSSGWLAIRSVRNVACPVDGWLAVSAGRRAAETATGVDALAQDGKPACTAPSGPATSGGPTTVTEWPSYLKQAAADTYEAHPGTLGTALATAGKKAAAVGPGAAIALADTNGQVARAWPGPVDDGNGIVAPTELADEVTKALATDPRLLVVDLGTVRDPARQVEGAPPLTGAWARPKAAQIQALDVRLALVLAQLPANATVIVASLADSGSPTQLQLLAARGPAPIGGTYTDSLLGSRSTRQDGLAQTTDLLPTLLTSLSVDIPIEAVGAALSPVSAGGTGNDRLVHLEDLADASTAVTPIVPKFFNGLVIAQIVLYGVATLILRRRSRSAPDDVAARRRTLQLLRQAAVVFACVPAASFLANLLPWWRSGTPGFAVTGAVIAFVVPMAALALLGPWRKALLGPMGVVGALTAAVLAVDAATGSKLTLSSLMGVQPVVAGRFYGFGNVAFALFATGALLLAIGAADALVKSDRARLAVLAVLVVGLVTTAIDGTPGIGSDVGGPPAIIPAFAVLTLLVAGVRITVRRALMIAGITIGVIVALGVLDWLRAPGDRTHLGRFVQSLIDGDAWPVVKRKGEQNLHILFSSWLSALLPFAVAFVVLVLARPVSWGVRPLQLAYDRSPILRSGLIAFGVLMLIGTALNDSGTVVPAVAATVAIPLLIAASVRALELQDAERPGPEADATPSSAPPPTPPEPTTAQPLGGSPA
jgi:hypothetical protein